MVARTPTRAHPTANARNVSRIFFRHKKKMAAFFAGTLILVVAGLVFFPRSYVSDARLFVRLGKESVALDPTATLGQTVNVEGSRESEINSELEILRSRALFEEVVDKLGADVVLGTGNEAERSWVDTALAPIRGVASWLSQSQDVSREEVAIGRLEKAITVTAPRKSSVIIIKCKARDPQLAQRMLQTYLDVYLVQHARANRTPGSHDFFVDQSGLLRQKLNDTNQRLTAVKNEVVLLSVDGHRTNVQAQVDSIEAAMLQNKRALSASQAKVAALKKALEELPPQVQAEETVGFPNVAADSMRNELYKLQILEQDARSRFTEEHPRVRAIARQVAELQKILGEQGEHRSQATNKLNTVHQGVQTDLAAEQAISAALTAEAQSLEEQYATVQEKVRALNNKEVEVLDLTREAELLEASFRNYTNNLEQARIDSALEQDRISNVNVVQPAALIVKAANPKVRVVLALGLFVATLGSVLLAFAAEYLDRTLKTPAQVERELGLPVLLSVPRHARHQLLHN